MRSTSERRYKVITIIEDCPVRVETIVKGLDSATLLVAKNKVTLEKRGVYGNVWFRRIKKHS